MSTYGIGAELSRDHWQSLIRQLIHRGYLAQDIARFSALRLTDAARPLLRGDETLIMAKPRVRVPTKKQRLRTQRAGRAAELAGMPVDEALFEALRGLRKRLADEQNVPAYVVFSDATLAEMAARRPATRAELLEVNGVGQAKLERYGDAFLARDRRAGLRRLGPRRARLASGRRAGGPARRRDAAGGATAGRRRGTSRADSRPCSRARFSPLRIEGSACAVCGVRCMHTIAPGWTWESTRDVIAPAPGWLQSRGSTSQRMTR